MALDLQIVERNKGKIIEGIAYQDIPIGSIVVPYCAAGSDPDTISFALNTTVLLPSWFICCSNIYGEALPVFKGGEHIRCLCMLPGDIAHIRTEVAVTAGTRLFESTTTPGTALVAPGGIWYTSVAIEDSITYDFGYILTKVIFG